MIFIVRTTMGQEKVIIRMLWRKAKKEQLPIYAIVSADRIKGYMFIEAKDENAVSKLISGVKNVKGMLRSTISLSDMEKVLKREEKEAIRIEVGDVVEMAAGPFKGERAKVVSLDPAKDEITVELLDVAVPVPVTVKNRMVKLAQKAEE